MRRPARSASERRKRNVPRPNLRCVVVTGRDLLLGPGTGLVSPHVMTRPAERWRRRQHGKRDRKDSCCLVHDTLLSRVLSNIEIIPKRAAERDQRELADFRRSGAVEAIAGDATPAALSHAMGNTLATSNTLFATYVPVNHATLRAVMEARRRGRSKLR